jgi:Family of unknown function (DUF5362)
MEHTNDVSLFDLKVDQQAAGYLSETAKWARFLSILGFIFCGLIFICSFFIGTLIATAMTNFYGSPGLFGSSFFTVFYLGIGLLIFFPTLYLFNFSRKMKNAVRANDQLALDNSLKNLKSFFKFNGIVAIITISLYTLAIIFAIVGVMVGRH